MYENVMMKSVKNVQKNKIMLFMSFGSIISYLGVNHKLNNSIKKYFLPGMVAHVYNTSTQENKTRGS
jgi:hypothetical protein